MYNKKDIANYIQSKKMAWSATTTKSEAARLYAMLPFLATSGQALYDQLKQKGNKPYTIRTSFIRAGEFLEFMGVPIMGNAFKQYLQTNANVFKNAYTKERVTVSIEEARRRIANISHPQAREMALFLLASGLRAHEGLKYDKDVNQGMVIGKGARMRRVFNGELCPKGISKLEYITLYTELKKVDLKPHTLRKLAATAMVRAGFKEAELMYVMGWQSMQTASSYIQPQADDVIANKMKEVLGGTK